MLPPSLAVWPLLYRSWLMAVFVFSFCQRSFLTAEEGFTPVMCPSSSGCTIDPVILWGGGLVAIVGAGVLGYNVGKGLSDRENEGDRGPRGHAGPSGVPGNGGGPGTYGSPGPQGLRGVRGPTGAAGVQGPVGGVPIGPNDLSFYFFNSSDNPESSLVGIVTTPEAKQYTTVSIGARTGAFTQEYPLRQPPVGVYHLTIVPDSRGYHPATEVIVLKQGVKEAVLKYSPGIYSPQAQATIDYTYYPNQR